MSRCLFCGRRVWPGFLDNVSLALWILRKGLMEGYCEACHARAAGAGWGCGSCERWNSGHVARCIWCAGDRSAPPDRAAEKETGK